jgi:plastocyanin
MPRSLTVGTIATFLLVLSVPLVAAPDALAESTVSVTIPSGAGGGAAGAPGYSPDSVTVVIGVNSTVVWTNDDSVGNTVTSVSVPAGAAPFDSGLIEPSTSHGMPWQTPTGGTFSETFTVPGTYQYHCTAHSWMTGTVIVLAASTPAPEFPSGYLALVLFAVMAIGLLAIPGLKNAGSRMTRLRRVMRGDFPLWRAR